VCRLKHVLVNKDINDFVAIYEKLKVHFEDSKWFKEESWRCSVAEGQDKCSLLLDKPLWDEHQVYFVTWVAEHELKRNNIKVALVVEDELLGRKEFVKSLEQGFQIITNGWGYALRPQKRLILCKKISPLDKNTLFTTVEDEFSKLKQLGTIVDKTIEETCEKG
jgi:hypothetical protein